jgi:hypothetical protein
VFVGYGGVVTSQNLAVLREHGHGHIVSRNRHRSGEVYDYIQSATGSWIKCPAGITVREKATQPKTLVQEVASKEPAVRVFVIHSEERASDRGASPISRRCRAAPQRTVISDVERAFTDLKDVLDMRPIYHQTDNRVQAHIYVATLGLLIHRAIEKKLKAARIDLSASEELTALKSVRVRRYRPR